MALLRARIHNFFSVAPSGDEVNRTRRAIRGEPDRISTRKQILWIDPTDIRRWNVCLHAIFKIGGGFYETDSDRRGIRTSHPALTARAADGVQRKDCRPASGRDGCGDADLRAADPV